MRSEGAVEVCPDICNLRRALGCGVDGKESDTLELDFGEEFISKGDEDFSLTNGSWFNLDEVGSLIGDGCCFVGEVMDDTLSF